MPTMGALESKFADIIWEREPLPSGQLVKLAAAALNWKPTTSYTVLKRLCERGIFVNNNGVVSSLISRDDFYAMQCENFVDETFSGSLPAFVAAFGKRKKLSEISIGDPKIYILTNKYA